MPPYDYGASQNVPLLLGIRRHVPEDARVSFLPRGGLAEQRLFIATGWIRWVGFVIAPRLVDAGSALALGRARSSDAEERRDPAAPGVALRPGLARRAVIRGLVGIGLALLALLPLGGGVLLLARTPFRVGLAVFSGLAAAMVLLPPLALPRSRAVDLARARARRARSRARACVRLSRACAAADRVAAARRAVDAARPARRARSGKARRHVRRVRELDAEGEAPLLRPELLGRDDRAAGAPRVSARAPVTRGVRAARDRQRERARAARAVRGVPRRARARRVARSASARLDVAARRRPQPRALDAGGAGSSD